MFVCVIKAEESIHVNKSTILKYTLITTLMFGPVDNKGCAVSETGTLKMVIWLDR